MHGGFSSLGRGVGWGVGGEGLGGGRWEGVFGVLGFRFNSFSTLGCGRGSHSSRLP